MAQMGLLLLLLLPLASLAYDDACSWQPADGSPGQRVPLPDNAPCSDGVNCTLGDYCVGGFCISGYPDHGGLCRPLADARACAVGRCDAAAAQADHNGCVQEWLRNGTRCRQPGLLCLRETRCNGRGVCQDVAAGAVSMNPLPPPRLVCMEVRCDNQSGQWEHATAACRCADLQPADGADWHRRCSQSSAAATTPPPPSTAALSLAGWPVPPAVASALGPGTVALGWAARRDLLIGVMLALGGCLVLAVGFLVSARLRRAARCPGQPHLEHHSLGTATASKSGDDQSSSDELDSRAANGHSADRGESDDMSIERLQGGPVAATPPWILSTDSSD